MGNKKNAVDRLIDIVVNQRKRIEKFFLVGVIFSAVLSLLVCLLYTSHFF